MKPDHLWLAILGVGLTTLVTRCLFLLPDRELPLPPWVRRALQYAPLAALVAIVAPEVAWTSAGLLDTWRSARLWSVVVATGYFLAVRGLFGSLVSGSAVYLALRLGLGWSGG